MLPNEESAGVCDTLVEVCALGFVEEGGLGFVETVECVGGRGIGCFVGVDEEGFLAVLDFYVGVGHAGLEVKDCVAVKEDILRLGSCGSGGSGE